LRLSAAVPDPRDSTLLQLGIELKRNDKIES
jgi:hypothetical protein